VGVGGDFDAVGEAEAEWGERLTSAAGFRELLHQLASEAGKAPQIVIDAPRERFADQITRYVEVITAMEEEASTLAAQMREAREAALGAAICADGEAVERVVRLEAHLARQLTLALDLLERLRGEQSQAGVGGLGALVRGLAVGAARSLPLTVPVGSFRTEEVGGERLDPLPHTHLPNDAPGLGLSQARLPITPKKDPPSRPEPT
jgi:hypothetical protein